MVPGPWNAGRLTTMGCEGTLGDYTLSSKVMKLLYFNKLDLKKFIFNIFGVQKSEIKSASKQDWASFRQAIP